MRGLLRHLAGPTRISLALHPGYVPSREVAAGVPLTRLGRRRFASFLVERLFLTAVAAPRRTRALPLAQLRSLSDPGEHWGRSTRSGLRRSWFRRGTFHNVGIV